MIAEISMKAKLLRTKLKNDPSSVREVSRSLDVLEKEMFLCMVEFNEVMAK